ncbi:hypothetical protein [Aureimonas sp. AU40]|uniref:hypothetical protein n=1 Tax=Aureimonas sp. AU40 TaxID=1637747 RepID=UPI000A6734DA|nr:hypothetical protein [Aureimonas sp. AU40]
MENLSKSEARDLEAQTQKLYEAVGRAMLAFSGIDSCFAIILGRLSLAQDTTLASLTIYSTNSVDRKLELVKEMIDLRLSNIATISSKHAHMVEFLTKSFDEISKKIRRTKKIRNRCAHGNLLNGKTQRGTIYVRLIEPMLIPANLIKMSNLDPRTIPGTSQNDILVMVGECDGIRENLMLLAQLIEPSLLQSKDCSALDPIARKLGLAVQIPFHPPQ